MMESKLEEQVIFSLHKNKQTIATAESLTAGALCSRLATIPGASAVLRGGLIVYATDLKHSLAGVRKSTLDHDGPVAPTTALELAHGARIRCRADIGVGLTGVAGPDSQDGHPPGTVFMSVVGPETTSRFSHNLSEQQGSSLIESSLGSSSLDSFYEDLCTQKKLHTVGFSLNGETIGSVIYRDNASVAHMNLVGNRNQIRLTTVDAALLLVLNMYKGFYSE